MYFCKLDRVRELTCDYSSLSYTLGSSTICAEYLTKVKIPQNSTSQYLHISIFAIATLRGMLYFLLHFI